MSLFVRQKIQHLLKTVYFLIYLCQKVMEITLASFVWLSWRTETVSLSTLSKVAYYQPKTERVTQFQIYFFYLSTFSFLNSRRKQQIR